MANLVIIESPNKAAAIRNYLGSNYVVMASNGHIRDLPKSTMGVDIDNDFAPHYINIRGKGDIIRNLKKAAKKATHVYLATDPDREGEAISWHLAHELEIPPEKNCRVTFNAITKDVVKDAIRHPRKINENLVDAQQARRILDRIVGYKLSPFLWKNVKSGLSAGRVQTVATRIIVERENEIRAFIPKEYWTIDVDLQTESGEIVTARLYGNKEGKLKLDNEGDANRVLLSVGDNPLHVADVRQVRKQKLPAPPFNTFTMQQEASRKLGFQSQRIMKVAQELYEGVNLGAEFGGVQGLITYMRTDSLRVSEGAQKAALDVIREEYGQEYCPQTPRVYKTKNNAQDAHEAIRPNDVTIHPKKIRKLLTPDQYRLYKLIWERFVASQMASAVLSTETIDFVCNDYLFRASGYTVQFRGYMAVYGDASDEESEEDGAQKRLPSLTVGTMLPHQPLVAQKHFTEPPPRYTEASLIKFLDENGIGRPSTITTIVTTIFARNYVKRDGKSLVPTPLGEVTTKLMCDSFPQIVNYEFTASMEDRLDKIEQGNLDMKTVLHDFYSDFETALARANTEAKDKSIDVPLEESSYPCEKCGRMMVYKTGRYGKFLACPGFPECHNTKAIDKDGKPVAPKEKAPAELADFKCELCGGDVVLRKGRYGDFYACANYPQCKFTKPKVVDIGVACPDCGARVVAKRGRGKMQFYSCEKYPTCQFSSWDMPLNMKCPDCGQILYRRRGRGMVVCKNKACGYKSEVDMEKEENGADQE